MDSRRLGSLTTSAIGMGCWPIAGYVHDHAAGTAERVVHAALDAGVRLFDTARTYCPGDELGFGERQLAAALTTWHGDRADVLVATKVVSTPGPKGAWVADGSRDGVRSMAIDACRNLGVEHLDILQSHTVDYAVPWAETVGAMLELREEGLVREVGLSNVSLTQLEQALALGPIASVQNEFGPDTPDRDVLDVCTSAGVTFLPYSPFGGPGRGARELPTRHPVLAEVAARHDGATPHQVCLAWLLALSPIMLPIPAATRPQTITASAEAANLALTPDDLAALALLV